MDWRRAGGYGLLDNYLRSETYLVDSFDYLIPHLIVAAIAGIATAQALLRSAHPRAVPRAIVFGLAMLFTLPAGIASYSALVRLGQVFGEPLVERTYHRDASCTRLLPDDHELPQMVFAGWLKDYWCQFPLDKPIRLPVRKGLLGFYQVDQSAYAADIEAFRRRTRKPAR